MRRYDGSREDREELEARLDALRTPDKERRAGRKKRRRSVGPLVLGLLLLVGALVAVYSIFTAATGDEEASEGPVKVEVVKGDTLSSVAEKLEATGVIRSALVFKLEARAEGRSTEIQTGKYTFEPGADNDEIMRKLTAGQAAPTFALTIPEGLTLKETAKTVAADTEIPARAFEEAAGETDYGYAFLQEEGIKNTEGFLFPSKYELEEGTTAPQIVNRLLGQYLLETEGLDLAGAKERLGLTEYEFVTVASLIEKESANAAERPVIASVIYNRIDRGMPLQIDASIQYALKKSKKNLSLADLEVDSPYNTYLHEGLPPGPICSPSREALEAAMQPAQTDYLYYVLKANGREHFFTRDYDAFLRAKAEAGR